MATGFDLEGLCSSVLPVHGQGALVLSIDGRPFRVGLTPGRATGEFVLEFGEERERVFAVQRGGIHFIHFRGRAHRVEAIDALARARKRAVAESGEESLLAPMPGVVVRVAVEADEEVEAGDLLMVIESMKLQTSIRAPHDGRVAEICLGTGASFEQGATLVRLETRDEDSEAEQAKERER